MLRIETDAEQMGFAGEGGIAIELAIYLGELAGHARAIIREGTASVNKGYEQNFAAVLIEENVLVTLIDELEIGHGVAGGRQVQS